MGRTPRTKKEFLADGTVGFIFSTFAVVVGVETSVNAHSTVVAMFEILGTPHTAEPAVRAMVRALVVGHPEVANITVVLSHLNATLGALVSVKIMRKRMQRAKLNLRNKKEYRIFSNFKKSEQIHPFKTHIKNLSQKIQE